MNCAHRKGLGCMGFRSLVEDCTGSGNHLCGRVAELIFVLGKGDHTKTPVPWFPVYLGFPLTHCLYWV
jgi:hypothetical protein